MLLAQWFLSVSTIRAADDAAAAGVVRGVCGRDGGHDVGSQADLWSCKWG